MTTKGCSFQNDEKTIDIDIDMGIVKKRKMNE